MLLFFYYKKLPNIIFSTFPVIPRKYDNITRKKKQKNKKTKKKTRKFDLHT
jgi:hypothetical protein